MGPLPRLVWDQLKSVTAPELVRALKRDGWEEEETRGATRGFIKHDEIGSRTTRRRVVVHFHPGKVFGKGLWKMLLAETGWTAKDLKRLKLVKRIP